MKIGVMTFWFGKENYGMMLQCWALQQVLKQMGHSPYIIRFRPANRGKGLLGFMSYCLREVRGFFSVSRKQKQIIKQRGFNAFLKKYISVSSRTYDRLSELKKKPPVADCYIAGSDQIWAQLLCNNDNRAYFLDFGDKRVKRVAYAPSFAMKSYPKELKQDLSQLLKNFDSVSCREYDGVDICLECGVNAEKVIDPTMLIDKDVYMSLLSNSVQSKKTVFIYSLNIKEPEDIRWNELKTYATEKSLSFVVTPSNGYFKGNELFEGVSYSYATVPEWLENIYTSKIVVTPSFHGIVFSIILERDFVFVPLKGKCAKGNNRIYDLLKDLKLENRILNDTTTYEKILHTPINWEEVRSLLGQMKNSSLRFLENSLNI